MIIPLAISVALLGGVATWLFMATNAFLIWAAFVAWACFYHSGGDATAFRTTIISNVFGVVVAWAAGLALVSFPGGPVWGATIVALSIFIYILAAHIRLFASIPAVTYGYACTFAFLTQNADAFTPEVMLSATGRNALILIPFSMIIGACFAYASALFAAQIDKLVPSHAAKAT
ncbi:DUF1097 domain-containing protein [Kaistia dalseonensis]|uniref:DUF1097 domain-containing protein n=1 Tax=Kaistia dalseonensis TaxID=410840 RepID=A0ABU0H7C7_9HYPH|nr:DUF1097 domain-containing protein [Kaistia dalseonensis]MCX5495624.1 DUF1097 domain-containing protein [Kaistia dalseonensis]MDQ0438217.1 hypothetical protein [Kaistia dalseonensis]